MKVAIYWYGAEGQASYRYYHELGHDVTIVTPQVSPKFPLPAGAKSYVGEDALSHLNGYDLVIRSAGVRPDSIKTDGKIWSATNEFFAKCPAPIIGVTGTKGKGTTCSLIASILRAAGKTVHLVGNIGTPALDKLSSIQPDDVVVFELSSFQLWDLEKSPHVAVVLMIEPDHLDIHSDFSEYIQAKQNIAKHQTAGDVVIYHPSNQFSKQIAATSGGRQVRYGVNSDGGVYVSLNNFCVQGRTICSVDTLNIAGQHNIENACAAISAVYALFRGITDKAISSGLANFDGLPHRLKFVAKKAGVRFYDDSIATTPGSAIAALRSFTQPKVLILGGYDKGADYTSLANEVVQQAVRAVVLIGSNASVLGQTLWQAGLGEDKIITKGMAPMSEVVGAAAGLTQPGDVVILSPAAASFDQYASYTDRGEQFVAAVKAL